MRTRPVAGSTSRTGRSGSLSAAIRVSTGSASGKEHISYEQAYGRPFDDMLIRQPDLTKIRGLIGYEPKYTLDETLDEIIEYEKNALRANGGGQGT